MKIAISKVQRILFSVNRSPFFSPARSKACPIRSSPLPLRPIISRMDSFFFDCKLIADPAAKKVYLGRPWRPNAKTVFIRTDMGSHILPVGWENWGNVANEKTVLYAEYGSTGAGGNTSKRVAWSKQLSPKEASAYTLAAIFSNKSAWVPIADRP